MAGGVQAGRLSIEIVAEIARLQQDLDKAKRAVAAASGDIAKSARAANDNLANMGKGATAMGNSSRLAGHHVQNLTFQLNDMVVGLASGQKPMTVFMQQGMQIGQIMQMAGLGLGGFIKQLGLMLVPFTPIIAALGVMASGLALVTHEVDQNSKMHITWMDVVLGAYDAIVAETKGSLTGALKSYGATSGEVFKSVWEYAKTAFNLIHGIGTMIPRTIAEAWSTLPAAVGEAAVAAANAAIRAMNALMKAAVDVVNGYIGKINAAMAVVNSIAGTAFSSIPTISAPQVNQIANQFAGAGVKFGVAMGKAVVDTFNRDFVGESAALVQPFAEARARKRMADLGKKGGADAGKAAGKAAGDAFAEELAKSLAKGWNDAFGQAMERTRAILEGNTNVDWSEMLRSANDNLDKAQKPLKDAADEQMRWNEELDKTLGYLRQLGGLGGKIADIAVILQGLNSGNLANLPGKAGGMIGLLNQTDFGRDFLGNFEGTLDKFFGGTGQFTQALGAFGVAVQANQMIGEVFGFKGGPLGIFTSLFNKLFTSVPKASAIIGVTGGALGSTVKGNSNSRKAASTEGANSVIGALSAIADAFGVTFGSSAVSIGVRKKDYVVDPTGQGRTKGAGVLNFGKDSEAALKAAIADAISDGVFVGLSAGVERLLKNGDVEKQLQKALSFQAVFDDLANATDPAKAAQDAITKWADGMAKIFAEAGATADELAKLETLTGIKRADAAKAAAEAVLEAERPRRELEIQIMELEGKTAEALAAARQLELDGMDAALRPLMERIHALQTEADLAAKAAAITAQRHELELQLLEIMDPVAGALARQVDALNALDPSLRGAQQAVWDAKEAFDAAAQSAKDAADALKAAFEGVQTMVDQRRALTIQIAQLIDPLAAQELERADALRASAPANRELLQQYWSILDATTAATAAEKELADARDAAAKLAEQRRGLEIQLADVLNPAMAEAMRRADALAALTDPISRGLQEQIYAALDLKAAQEAVTKAEQDRAALEEARLATIVSTRNALIDAYDRENQALQGTIDKFSGFAETIRQFRDGLTGANGTTGFAMTRDQFRSTSRMAQFGDEGALGRFSGDAQAYLDAARDRVGSGAEYRRILAEVLGGSNKAIGGATGMASVAQQQLEQMKAQVGELVGVNERTETLVSVSQALAAYQAALAVEIPMQSETIATGMEAVASAVTTQTAQIATTSANQQSALDAMALALVRLERKFDTAFQDGALRVTSDETLAVTVANTSANPVPVDTTP